MSPDAALEKLCREYWPAVFAHVRRQGYSHHEAEDLTQEFFSRLLANGSLTAVAPQGARFPSWLAAALRNFLINEWKRSTRLKRGGGLAVLSLEAMGPQQRRACEPVNHRTPETDCECRWMETVLTRANSRLRRDYEAAGMDARFDALKSSLPQVDGSFPCEAVVRQPGLKNGALRSAVYRLRQRYGAIVRAQMAEILDNAGEVEDEIRHLLAVLCNSGGNSAS